MNIVAIMSNVMRQREPDLSAIRCTRWLGEAFLQYIFAGI